MHACLVANDRCRSTISQSMYHANTDSGHALAHSVLHCNALALLVFSAIVCSLLLMDVTGSLLCYRLAGMTTSMDVTFSTRQTFCIHPCLMS